MHLISNANSLTTAKVQAQATAEAGEACCSAGLGWTFITPATRLSKHRVSSKITTFSFGFLQTSALRDLPSCSVSRNGTRSLPSYKHRIGKPELSPDLYQGGASGTHPATKRPIFDEPLKLPVALLDFLSASGVLRKHCHPATVEGEYPAWD